MGEGKSKKKYKLQNLLMQIQGGSVVLSRHYDCNSIHAYLGASPIDYRGTYFYVDMHRIGLSWVSLDE